MNSSPSLWSYMRLSQPRCSICSWTCWTAWSSQGPTSQAFLFFLHSNGLLWASWHMHTSCFGGHRVRVLNPKIWAWILYLNLEVQGLGFSQKILPSSLDIALIVEMVFSFHLNSSLSPLAGTCIVISVIMSWSCERKLTRILVCSNDIYIQQNCCYPMECWKSCLLVLL